MVDDLDFDENTNAGELASLRETLFWLSFTSRKVQYVSSFSETQQRYTKRFRSGLVAPVVLHEIPFALLCAGSKDTDVFKEGDIEIACTFVDSIAEFIRLERICCALAESAKVVIMRDEASLLEALDRLRLELTEGRKEKA